MKVKYEDFIAIGTADSFVDHINYAIDEVVNSPLTSSCGILRYTASKNTDINVNIIANGGHHMRLYAVKSVDLAEFRETLTAMLKYQAERIVDMYVHDDEQEKLFVKIVSDTGNIDNGIFIRICRQDNRLFETRVFVG